jgi:hypothetical protein
MFSLHSLISVGAKQQVGIENQYQLLMTAPDTSGGELLCEFVRWRQIQIHLARRLGERHLGAKLIGLAFDGSHHQPKSSSAKFLSGLIAAVATATLAGIAVAQPFGEVLSERSPSFFSSFEIGYLGSPAALFSSILIAMRLGA